MEQNKSKVWLIVLVAVVIVLALVLLYILVVQPSITGYAVQRQQEGYIVAIQDILMQVQQEGYVAIPVGNQTLYLAPFNPQQATQQPDQLTQPTQPAE